MCLTQLAKAQILFIFDKNAYFLGSFCCSFLPEKITHIKYNTYVKRKEKNMRTSIEFSDNILTVETFEDLGNAIDDLDVGRLEFSEPIRKVIIKNINPQS